VDVDEFVAVKSRKAKGKRLTTYDVDTLTFIEPEEPEIIEEEPIEDVEVEEIAEEMIEEQESPTPIMMTEEEEYKVAQLDLF
jgi:topoisomerase-4 subunit A